MRPKFYYVDPPLHDPILIHGSAPEILAIKRPLGGAPEVNVRNPCCAVDEVHKRGDPLPPDPGSP